MPGARHCDVIRKGVALDSIEKHINKLEKVVTDQKQQAEERQIFLEKKKQQVKQDARVSKTINTKLDLKAAKCFKRSNSYVYQLDEFGDLRDLEELGKAEFAARGSVVLDRDIFNPKINDKTNYHIEDGASQPDVRSLYAGGKSSMVALTDSHAGSNVNQSRNFGGKGMGDPRTQSALVLQNVNTSQGGTMRLGGVNDPRMILLAGGQQKNQKPLEASGMLDSQEGVNVGDVKKFDS